jgi:hypothetical protein
VREPEHREQNEEAVHAGSNDNGRARRHGIVGP